MIPSYCPACGADFKGAEIPKVYRDAGYYGDNTHYSRVWLGTDYRSGVKVKHWHCPDCNHEWPRDDDKSPTP